MEIGLVELLAGGSSKRVESAEEGTSGAGFCGFLAAAANAGAQGAERRAAVPIPQGESPPPAASGAEVSGNAPDSGMMQAGAVAQDADSQTAGLGGGRKKAQFLSPADVLSVCPLMGAPTPVVAGDNATAAEGDSRSGDSGTEDPLADALDPLKGLGVERSQSLRPDQKGFAADVHRAEQASQSQAVWGRESRSAGNPPAGLQAAAVRPWTVSDAPEAPQGQPDAEEGVASAATPQQRPPDDFRPAEGLAQGRDALPGELASEEPTVTHWAARAAESNPAASYLHRHRVPADTPVAARPDPESSVASVRGQASELPARAMGRADPEIERASALSGSEVLDEAALEPLEAKGTKAPAEVPKGELPLAERKQVGVIDVGVSSKGDPTPGHPRDEDEGPSSGLATTSEVRHHLAGAPEESRAPRAGQKVPAGRSSRDREEQVAAVERFGLASTESARAADAPEAATAQPERVGAFADSPGSSKIVGAESPRGERPVDARGVAAEAPTPAEQVSRVIRLSMSPRGDRVTVQLEPEHLGKVQVVLTREPEGLVANFRVETPAAQGALAAEAATLRNEMEARGIPLVRVSVELESQTPDRRSAREERKSARRSPVTPLEDAGISADLGSSWRVSGFETTA